MVGVLGFVDAEKAGQEIVRQLHRLTHSRPRVHANTPQTPSASFETDLIEREGATRSSPPDDSVDRSRALPDRVERRDER